MPLISVSFQVMLRSDGLCVSLTHAVALAGIDIVAVVLSMFPDLSVTLRDGLITSLNKGSVVVLVAVPNVT